MDSAEIAHGAIAPRVETSIDGAFDGESRERGYQKCREKRGRAARR
jgi:hypothetical protein